MNKYGALRRKKESTVFLTYLFQGKNGGSGVANNTTYSTTRNIVTEKEIREAEKEIAKKFNYKAVTITNFEII